MIETTTRGHVLEITLNRPEAMNALSPEMTRDLTEALTAFDKDDSLRVALITGAGERAFCAGADLGRMQQSLESQPATTTPRAESPGGPSFVALELSKPVVGAINGHCLAAGLGLALLCDVRIAAENATFGCMGTVRGIVPGAGQTQRLPRLVGMANAMWLLLSAERIDAQEAFRIGLVNKVVPREDVLQTAREWADLLASRAPLAVQAAKQAALGGVELPLMDGLALESTLGAKPRASEDALEGVRAFNEKRTPIFRGV
jgi:enoyl-CoA hydratase/carnithine racemase